jgi:hypothetical protein
MKFIVFTGYKHTVNTMYIHCSKSYSCFSFHVMQEGTDAPFFTRLCCAIRQKTREEAGHENKIYFCLTTGGNTKRATTVLDRKFECC